MKLTKKTIRELETILHHIERAGNVVRSEETAFARKTDIAMMPEHTLSRKSDGVQFGIMNKERGSDLCGLFDAEKGLRRMIESALS